MASIGSIVRIAAVLLFGSAASAQVTYTFEGSNPLDSSLIGGDKSNFVTSTAQAVSGSQSLRFDYSTPDPFQSWTYDMPFTIENGQISVWFYDALGDNRDFNKYGGSIILEDADTPGDFVAVEIWNAPYPGAEPVKNYFITRGSAAGATTFRSTYFGDRSVGWHQVVFNLTPSASTVTVDGIENASGAGIISGPGTSDNLRLRFMAWSASNGGFSNWTTNPAPSTGLAVTSDYVYFDDLTITATTPTAQSRTEGFEVVSSVATYDAPTEFMGPTGFDNPYMKGFVPQWGPNTNASFVRTGAQSFHFVGSDPTFKSLTFDLSTAVPGDITLSFYDLLGSDVGFDKVGGSIIIEQVSDPANFIAAEIWNAPYPSAEATKNYFITKGTSASQATTFRSGYFGDRSVGWQNVTISLTPTTSQIRINGIENANSAGILTGPGINDGIRLRLMADSPSCGGFTNYRHPSTTELNYLYLDKSQPYLLFDDVSLPVPVPSSVDGWMSYE